MQKLIRLTSFWSWIRSRDLLSKSPELLKTSPSSSWFRDIDELPLDRFISIICAPDEDPDQPRDLSLLIKTGEPAREDLESAWIAIFLQYVDASRDSKTRFKIALAREIAILEARLSQIESLLFLLQTLRVQEAVDILRSKGNEDLVFPADNIDQYFEDLNLARNRSREIKIDLELKIIERNEFNKSENLEINKRADKASFLNILARIATFKKVAVIRTSEITVAEFCAMLAEYLDTNKAVSTNKTR